MLRFNFCTLVAQSVRATRVRVCVCLWTGNNMSANWIRTLALSLRTLDLKGADINFDILNWDYTKYEPGYFDIIWASPPCNTFSYLRRCNLWREGFTEERIQNDIDNIGLPILRKTEETINYFKLLYYFIENPQMGKMKEYTNKPYYDVDSCKYADW